MSPLAPTQPAIESIIQALPLTLPTQTLVTEAIDQMSTTRTSSVLVTEGKQLAGIFTERDVVRLISSNTKLLGLTLGQMMTRNVVFLKSSEAIDIFSVSRLFNLHKIRHVPILDNADQVIGIATPESVRSHLKPEHLLRYIRVAEVMEKKIILGTPDEPLLSLVKKMAQHRVSCVVIHQPENNRPIGIITERDTVRFVSKGVDFNEVTAQNVMTTPLSVVNDQDSLWGVHEKMQTLNIRRLVVTEGYGTLAGIVTQSQLLKLLDPTEMYHVMQQMQQVIEQQTQELVSLNQDLQAANAKLKELASIDDLTQLLNRRSFNHWLKQKWHYHLRYKKPLSLLICDVDYFKAYNDTYGHLAGDRCLMVIAQALQEAIRFSSDMVARFGGEEFAVILPDTDSFGVEVVAKKIQACLKNVQNQYTSDTLAKPVTLSMGGVTTIPDESFSTEQLLETADQLLYQAKQQGRNTYRLKMLASL